MLLSMTGYGRAQAALGAGHVTIEARSLNHRYLDVRLRFPSELNDCTANAEAIVRANLGRGRVEMHAKTTGPVTGRVTLDRERARAVYRELESLRDELAPGEAVPISMLSSLPDLFVHSDANDSEAARSAVEAAVREAVDKLIAMRRKEGEALTRDLSDRLAAIHRIVEQIKPHTAEIVADYRKKLHKRIEALMSGSGVALDAAKLEHEVAAFADRTDINEELARLLSHCDQFDSLMTAAGTVGRRLDFLLQEMGREANTMGSKIADVEVTRHVVDLKAELERMREQVQNVL